MDSKCHICGEPCNKIPYGSIFLSYCKGGCKKPEPVAQESASTMGYSLIKGRQLGVSWAKVKLEEAFDRRVKAGRVKVKLEDEDKAENVSEGYKDYLGYIDRELDKVALSLGLTPAELTAPMPLSLTPAELTAPMPPEVAYGIPIGNYLAMDAYCVWAQYANEPTSRGAGWTDFYLDGTLENNTAPWPDWKDSLHLMTESGLVKVEDKQKVKTSSFLKSEEDNFGPVEGEGPMPDFSGKRHYLKEWHDTVFKSWLKDHYYGEGQGALTHESEVKDED